MPPHQPIGNPIDLASGELRFVLPRWIREHLADTAGSWSPRYQEGPAHPVLEARYRAFRKDLPAGATVLVTAGAKEATFLALGALLDTPRARVLVPTPAWPSYSRIARWLGAGVEWYGVRGGANPTDEIIDKLARLRPTALILNFPHNPTGAEVSLGDLRAILRAAQGLGTAVVSDEVYRPFGSLRAATVACDLSSGADVLLVDSASKWLALAGLRIGWLAASPRLATRVTELRSSCAGATTSTFGQAALGAILSDARCQPYVERLVSDARLCTETWRQRILARGDRILGCGSVYIWAEAAEAVAGRSLAFGPVLSTVAPGDQFGAADNLYRVCPCRQDVLEGIAQEAGTRRA